MSILGLLNQEITLTSKSGYGRKGRPTFSGAVAVKSRFEAKTKRILQPDGSVLSIDAIVIVPKGTTVVTDDKVTYDSNDYKVVDVFKVPDGTGNTNHKELRLVKWPT